MQPVTDQLIEAWSRPDAKGSEVEAVVKLRPWLVLSREGVHSRGIFVAAPHGSGQGRLTRHLCVADKASRPDGYVDAQQLWTMPNQRIHSSGIIPLAPRTAQDVRRKIRDYLQYSAGRRHGWIHQGKVVLLRLAPSRWTYLPEGGLGPSIDTDIMNWQTVAGQLTGTEPSFPEEWLVPAVVVTNDRYLPILGSDYRPSGVYPLITAVPLVKSEALRNLNAPIVSGPPGSSGDFVPLTQCLLTLDYAAMGADKKRGLVLNHPRCKYWTVTDATRRIILDQVLSVMNILSASSSAGSVPSGSS